jgi:glutamyl-tRNA reductase
LREQVLREAGGDAEKATRLLLGRILHDPTMALKSAAEGDGGELARLEAALRRLFGIGDNNEDQHK